MRIDQIKVFLSYSRKDEKEIFHIENVLAELGINRKNIFKDTTNIQAGVNWKDAIISAIRDANFCIFLWTKNVENSAVIESERTAAYENMNRINFDNGARKKEKQRLYKIIHVIAEELPYSSRSKLGKYSEIQQLRFQNRSIFFEQVGVRLVSAIKHDGVIPNLSSPEMIGNTCYRCGRGGHFYSDCFANRHVNGSYLDDKCYRCGRGGHFYSDCFANRHIDGYIIN